MNATTDTSVPRLVEPFGAYGELLRSAFNQVCDPNDWRGPINCLVPWEAANVYMQAIEFMTAVWPQCERVVKDRIPYAHLTCIGYRAGPAGA